MQEKKKRAEKTNKLKVTTTTQTLEFNQIQTSINENFVRTFFLYFCVTYIVLTYILPFFFEKILP